MTAEAFPLSWPDGWPRTPYNKQGASRFKADFVKVRSQLVSELRLLGARNVVISSNMALRNDGLPYADAARRKIDDPGVAVYFTLKDRQMVMARDLYWTPAENMRSIGLAVEHLRGLERHGGSFMMEKAFSGFAALPPPADWASTLGVSRNASKGEIMDAYRDLARKHHPDNGGSAEKMAEINVARDRALAAAIRI